MIEVVEAVRAYQTQEKTWIPKNLNDVSYFSVNDLWHYFGVSDSKLCDYCAVNDGMDFTGDVLRGKFPDLEIVDQNTIYPHVHKDLVRQGIFGGWSEDSCRCYLMRIVAPMDILTDLGV